MARTDIKLFYDLLDGRLTKRKKSDALKLLRIPVFT